MQYAIMSSNEDEITWRTIESFDALVDAILACDKVWTSGGHDELCIVDTHMSGDEGDNVLIHYL